MAFADPVSAGAASLSCLYGQSARSHLPFAKRKHGFSLLGFGDGLLPLPGPFAPRSEELPRIQNGTVTLIPVEDKQRVLDLLQEVLRFRIDLNLGYLISHLRGEAYLRTRKALGEDFCYVSTQPTEHLSNVPVAIRSGTMFLCMTVETFLPFGTTTLLEIENTWD